MKTLASVSLVLCGVLLSCGPVGSTAANAKCTGTIVYDQGTSTKILALATVKDRLVILSSNATILVHDPKDFVPNGPVPKLLGSLVLIPGLTGSSDGTLIISGTTGYAFIEGQLKVIDFSDPTMPTVTATVNSGPGFIAALNDTNLFDVAGQGFVRVLPLSNLGVMPLPTYQSLGASAMDVSGNTIAVVEMDSKRLSLYDMTNPASPTPLGKLTLPQTARGLRFDGKTLYAYDHDTLMSIDVTDLMNPKVLFDKGAVVTGRSAFPNVQSAWFAGKQLVVPGFGLGDGKGLNVFDVTDPTKPTYVPNTMCGPGLDMRFIVRAGTRLFVANERTVAVSD
jgi:hypothetical protein